MLQRMFLSICALFFCSIEGGAISKGVGKEVSHDSSDVGLLTVMLYHMEARLKKVETSLEEALKEKGINMIQVAFR